MCAILIKVAHTPPRGIWYIQLERMEIVENFLFQSKWDGLTKIRRVANSEKEAQRRVFSFNLEMSWQSNKSSNSGVKNANRHIPFWGIIIGLRQMEAAGRGCSFLQLNAFLARRRGYCWYWELGLYGLGENCTIVFIFSKWVPISRF